MERRIPDADHGHFHKMAGDFGDRALQIRGGCGYILEHGVAQPIPATHPPPVFGGSGGTRCEDITSSLPASA